jgi:hypothetical protein
MLNVYCIPGMGVDGRLFKNLRLEGCSIHHIKWQVPTYDESLADYAMRLSAQIDASKPFVLVGVSFGGMCAVEISKKMHPLKTFVISSCKTNTEIPFKLIFWKWLRAYKVLGNKRFISGARLLERRFGVVTDEQKKKFREMLNTMPEGYFKGAVHCIMSWKNSEVPPNVVHIHGSADQVLPIRKIKNCDHVIKGGSHFMIVDRAEEINEIMRSELSGVWS